MMAGRNDYVGRIGDVCHRPVLQEIRLRTTLSTLILQFNATAGENPGFDPTLFPPPLIWTATGS